jgi:hypothetical protein
MLPSREKIQLEFSQQHITILTTNLNQPATMQDLLEHRIRILETQMMQTMCINTAIHTQIALQSRSPQSPYIGQGGP